MTHRHTTTNGHEVQAATWKSSGRMNTQIHIDGAYYTDATGHDDFGRSTEESEAKLQADLTAADIESGRLAMVDGEWKLVEEVA